MSTVITELEFIENRSQAVWSSLEAHILGRLVHDLTRRLRSGARLLDVGCGRGDIVTRLARRFPHSLFTGIDASADAIDAARAEAVRQHLENVSFLVQNPHNVEDWGESNQYDGVTTFDILHDQSRSVTVARGIHRALRSDGVCLAQGGRELPPPQDRGGLSAFWGERKTVDWLRQAAFRSIEMYRLPDDMVDSWYIARK